MSTLIEIDEARERVLARVATGGAEPVAVADAPGRTLAEEVTAPDPVPGFDNSAMDGYAVRAADTAGAAPGSPARLTVVGESRAGAPADGMLGPGEAIEISTGAMVPAGADAVVRVEDTERDGVAVAVAVEVGRDHDVRHAGEDVEAGAAVLGRGAEIGPAEVGVLVAVGRAEVACARRPRVAILSTGDELQAPGEPLRPGGVRNSNSYALAALVERCGAEVASIALVRDEREATEAALADALGAEIVVVSGGASVGEHDHVRPALEALGVEREFWGVALRPGKPTYFGVAGGDAGERATLVFGLPGNPVSALVTFRLFVRPAIRAMLGAGDDRRRASAVLEVDYAKRPGRAHLVRCRLELRDDGWHATPTGAQGSHVLTSMLGADALAIIPSPRGDVAAGERVEVELLD